MNENQENRDMQAYTLLGILSALYALLLNTDKGKEFAKEYTWASVVIGTAMVLIVARLFLPETYWRKIAFSFVISGAPMIARSLLNHTK